MYHDYKIDVVDDFLNKEDYKELISIPTDNVSADKIELYNNEISKDNSIIKNSIDKSIVERLQKNYHHKLIKKLEKLCKEKIKLYDYSELSIIKTGKNYKFPIHDDGPDKILSCTVYLSPEKNAGTMFYSNKKGEGRKQIEWKPNRAVFFVRNEMTTWHSFGGDGISNRITLNYNLKTYKIKDVYKIEKKNYYYGKFRYKVNPYLYKYLKFTI